MLAIILLGCIAFAQSAPTEQATGSGLAAADMQMQAALPSMQQADLKPLQPIRQYLILTPEAQLQLQPAFKAQQSVIQPLALYGTAPSTRQFENICNQIQQGVGGFQEVLPIALPWFETGGGDESKKLNAKQQVPEFNTEAETIPQGALPVSPAAAVPLPEHRFYTIAGRPQFFGNVDILQNPLHPIFSLQTLQPLKARNVAELEIQGGRSPVNKMTESLPLPLPLQGNEEPLRQEQGQLAESAEASAEEIARRFAGRFNNKRELVEDDQQAIIAENTNIQPVPAAEELTDNRERIYQDRSVLDQQEGNPLLKAERSVKSGGMENIENIDVLLKTANL